MAYYILKSYKLNSRSFDLFRVLSKSRNCFFLDSSLAPNPSGRFSILGIEPFLTLKTKGSNPFEQIRQNLNLYKVNFSDSRLPFWGGAVGYLAYDLGLALEKKLKIRPKPNLGIPDCFFGFYNSAVIIDHIKGLFYILCLGLPEKKYSLAKKLAESNFKKLNRLLSYLPSQNDKAGLSQDAAVKDLASSFSKKDYLKAVVKAKQYIKAGDIYQVNLAQIFSAKSDLSSLEIYRRLRNKSPSCFSAYFDAGNFQILSSSPERFLKLENNIISTRPMKGTRSRSADLSRDNKLRQELIRSAKDKAELLMIVDLERNDLGRVSDYGSVKVRCLRQIEDYATVFQATASIESKLHKSKDSCDLLMSCFPGGSITGCPKIRSMEIIEELEPARRSIYTGALGYFSFSGSLDFNILIRTILKKGEDLCFGAGGGIVADSDPESEYQETLAKAKGIFQALGLKRKGLG